MGGEVKKLILNALVFALLAAITVYIVFCKGDVNEIVRTVRGAEPAWLLAGALCMCVFIGGEAVNLYRTLNLSGGGVAFFQCVKYAVIGFFFSAVTPSSSGGQPMQALYMRRDMIPISRSALALFAELAAFQCAILLYGAAAFFFAAPIIVRLPFLAKLTFVIGAALNAVIFLFLLTAVFSKRIAYFLARLALRLLKLLRIKKADAIYEGMTARISDYHLYSACLKASGSVLIKTLITSLVKIGALYSVSYCVYRALGLSQASFFTVFFCNALLFVAVSALPLPGAVGVTESGFPLLFSAVYPRHMIGGALILTRGVNFYLFVLLTGALVCVFVLTGRKKDMPPC